MRSDVVTLLILFSSVAAALTWSNVTQIQQVHDTVLPPNKVDSHGVLSASSPLPDWSDAKLHKHPFYVETLIAVDAGVSRFYGHNPEKLMQAIVSMMHAVNLYAAQLNIRIVVVDVVPVKGHNLSLEQFMEWRKEQSGLVSHDVAMLIRHRFEGGIAYVNGVCKRTAVGICGFFPEAPFEYASVFFHEMAHLLGLTHEIRVDCQCSKKNRLNCLRIDGFEHDCSAQALVDLLPNHDCLQPPAEVLPRTNVPICGNGVLEGDEDCDCGLQETCDNVFCEARSCRFIIRKDYLYKMFTMSTAVVIFSTCLLLKRMCSRAKGEKLPTSFKSPSMSRTCPIRTEIVVLSGTTTRNGILASQLPSQDSRLLSPPIGTMGVTNITNRMSSVPTRPAPPIPRPGNLKLDQPVPLAPRDCSPPPGYMKMHPPILPPFEKVPQTITVSKRIEDLTRGVAALPPPPPDAADKPQIHFYDRPPA